MEFGGVLANLMHLQDEAFSDVLHAIKGTEQELIA
jgi:hypothetical protein